MTGKMWAMIFIFFPLIMWAQDVTITLQISSLDGTAMQEVNQGEPFLITATVFGDQQGLGEPILTHKQKLDSCERMPVTTHITLINGQQKIQRQYTYKARIDAVGQCALGPAYFDLGSHIVQSSAVSFVVVPLSHAAPTNTALTDPFIYVKTNKTSLVVGEQLLVTVRLCYRKPMTQFVLEPFNMNTFFVLTLGQPVSETFMYDGRSWSCITYMFACYPQQAGELVIPSLQAHGAREKEDARSSFMSHFFFGVDMQPIAVHSAPLNISVKLVPTKRAIQAVGHFNSFSLTVDKTTLESSTAATLIMRLVGDGDMHQLGADMLQLPGVVRVYDAKASLSLEPQQPGMLVYTREWVLQGLQAGAVTIAPQSFTFFDPTLKLDRVLTTQPITLTIKPGAEQHTLPLTHAKSNAQHKPFEIAWWLIILLTVAPLLVVLFWYLWRSYAPIIEKKRAFYAFKRTLKRARRTHNAQLIYQAWFALLTRRLGAQRAPQTLGELESLFADELRIKWRYYVTRLEQEAFEDYQTVDDVLTLIEQTDDWFDALEDLL